MSMAGKALAVTVLAIAAIAVWRTARVRDAAPPSTADRAAPVLGTKPGGELGSTAPQPRDNIEEQVDRLSDRRGQIRGDTAATAGGGDQRARPDVSAARRRDLARRAGATNGSMDDTAEDPAEAAASAEDLASLKMKALTDPDPEERIDALGSLYSFDDADALPILQTALRDHEPEVRIAALDKLNDLNEPPVDLIATGMKDSSAEVRQRTVEILSGIDDPRAQALIRDARNDPDEDVRTTAELYAEDPDLVGSDSDSDEQ